MKYLELELRGPTPLPRPERALVDFARVRVRMEEFDVDAFKNLTASPKHSM